MTLESVLTSINKSAEGNKGLVLATGLYISAAILDNTLTYFGVTYGLEKEWNPVTQFYMDELGYGKGLIVSELLTYISFLGAR